MPELAAVARRGPVGAQLIHRPRVPGAAGRPACGPLVLIALGLLAASAGQANPPPSVPAPQDQPPADPAAVRQGERLSDWLLRQPPTDQRRRVGLSWQVPAATRSQAELRRALLVELAASPRILVPATGREWMAALLRSLPVTGRVVLPQVDARWLQAHPAQDPVLSDDEQLVLPALTPDAVAVLSPELGLCRAPHQAGALALDYLRACLGQVAGRVDQAWIVQPDGVVERFAIARWNRQSQDEPAPGSWIWAPARDAGWPEDFSAGLAAFLATQGPAMSDSGAASSDPGAAWSRWVAATAPRSRSEPDRDGAVSANDWGLAGLLQTPTARMAPAGEARAGFSHVYPYGRLNIMLQPLDWLEAGFRYTTVNNQPYGPASLSGSQTYKDKSVDVKLRLQPETALLPQLALGITDLGGTGLFSSEYLVANKRLGDLDASLGLAWGYLGSRGDLRNPLSLFSRRFDTRPAPDATQAGNFNPKSYFHGPTALFGGLQVQLPPDKWLLKLELDGNNYQHEPFANNRRQALPINAGVVYRASPLLDLGAGVERGNTLQLGLTLHGGLDRVHTPKIFDPPMPRVETGRNPGAPDWSRTAADLESQTQWTVSEIRVRGHELQVEFDGPYGVHLGERIDRAVAVLHRDAPADVERFTLSLVNRGLPLTDWVILRRAWVERHTQWLALPRPFAQDLQTEPQGMLDGPTVYEADRQRHGLGLEPTYQQSVGGPNGFVLFELGVGAPAEWRLDDSTWLAGFANLRLLDNYKNFTYDGPSLLPRVRTYVREYLTSARATLPNLQLTHVGRLGPDQYYSVYGGLLESMFAGVGGEWMLRPWNSPVALGLDVNEVQQRAFRQDFRLRDYRVATGHATLYWDTGWHGTHVNLSLGQYLAGDKGATLDVSRRFDNGVEFGAYATRTDVSAAQYGEGSFDKGIYVRVPFDVFMPMSGSTTANLRWIPLTRDGGARLDRAVTLYDLTGARDHRASSLRPAGSDGTGDAGDGGTDASPWHDFLGAGAEVGRAASSRAGAVGLLAGGAFVAASSLLDRPLAHWAATHQGGRWDSLGRNASRLPWVLALGTGVLYANAAGDAASYAAKDALMGTALTLAVATSAKYLVGRARPDAGLGPDHFQGPSAGSGHSSFPSLQTGAAFALATPLAQQLDLPWLYLLAGATAFGRIQQQQHFASDVVAGSLIGYGISGTLSGYSRHAVTNPSVAVTGPGQISTVWRF